MDSSCRKHCLDGLKGLEEAPGHPKHQTDVLPKQLLIIVTQKGHSKRLQPLSAKGINVQTKPLAVSKINSYTQWPGPQLATYARRRNACQPSSCGELRAKPAFSIWPNNTALINWFATLNLKALKISTGRSRERFSPVSPLCYCSLQLIFTSNRCHFKNKIK